MTKVIKEGEIKPPGKFTYHWTVSYRDKDLQRNVVSYFTENRGGNAFHAVIKRYSKEYSTPFLRIICD